MLTFDKATHTYRYNDSVVPSVTQVLDDMADWAGVPPDVLRYAADRGTAVHAACAMHQTGVLDRDSLDSRIAPYVDQFAQFQEDTGYEPELIEHRGIDTHYGYAGTADTVGPMRRSMYVIDIKTCASPPVLARLQTAAYANLLQLHFPRRRVKRGVLMLRPDDYQFIHHKENALDWQAFAGALSVYNWRNYNGITR